MPVQQLLLVNNQYFSFRARLLFVLDNATVALKIVSPDQPTLGALQEEER